jgi:hypothetical protein
MDEDPALHRIPVALMSAHTSIRRAFDKDRGRFMRDSMLLPKPLNLLHLLSIVSRVLPKPGAQASP